MIDEAAVLMFAEQIYATWRRSDEPLFIDLSVVDQERWRTFAFNLMFQYPALPRTPLAIIRRADRRG